MVPNLDVAANNPIEVRHGRKIVEASSAHINKGAAVANLMADTECDVILLAGDDTTDESMFRLAAHDPRILTVHVGDGDGETIAQHRVRSPAALRQLLQATLTQRVCGETA